MNEKLSTSVRGMIYGKYTIEISPLVEISTSWNNGGVSKDVFVVLGC